MESRVVVYHSDVLIYSVLELFDLLSFNFKLLQLNDLFELFIYDFLCIANNLLKLSMINSCSRHLSREAKFF